MFQIETPYASTLCPLTPISRHYWTIHNTLDTVRFKHSIHYR